MMIHDDTWYRWGVSSTGNQRTKSQFGMQSDTILFHSSVWRVFYLVRVEFGIFEFRESSRLQIHASHFQTCQDLTKSYEFVWWILKDGLSFRYDVSLENRLLPSIVNRGCRRAGAEPMAFTWTSTFPCRSPSRCARTVVMTETWTSFCGWMTWIEMMKSWALSWPFRCEICVRSHAIKP